MTKGEQPQEENKPSRGGHTTQGPEVCHTRREEESLEGTGHHHTKPQAPREGDPTNTCPPYNGSRPIQARHNTNQASQIHHTATQPATIKQSDNPSLHRAPVQGPTAKLRGCPWQSPPHARPESTEWTNPVKANHRPNPIKLCLSPIVKEKRQPARNTATPQPATH